MQVDASVSAGAGQITIAFALVFLLLAFLIGSIPTALIMGQLRGIDIRKHGSGNVGATNAFRVLGRAAGIACLLIDILKGFVPALVLGGAGGWIAAPGRLDRPTWTLLVGFAAIAGHAFSPWLRFRGGKGVATSLGVFLAVAPVAVLSCLAVGAGLILATGYVSLASLTGAILLPILIAALPREGGPPWAVVALTAMLGVFVVWKHRANIGRLINGTENKLTLRRDAAAVQSESK